MGMAHHKHHYLSIAALLVFTACTDVKVGPGLPSSSTLGSVRGQHYLRVQTHIHGPFSYDACDDKGLNKDGTVNPQCMHDLKNALCYNHVDVAFLTDHISHIADAKYSDMLLNEPGDTVVHNAAGDAVGNQVNCGDGFKAVTAPGLEASLLALGLERHVSEDWGTRVNTYGSGARPAMDLLEKNSNALVGIPHTESRSLEYLRQVHPDFMEIYNVHANLHPIIRRDVLHVSPFKPIFKFLKYLIDPLHLHNPDYLFMEFIEYFPVYLDRWNALLAEGFHITGTGGLDSHQNVVRLKVADGERLDSHRRMTRFLSNFVFTAKDDLASVKQAIRAGQLYVVMEGLGSPVGLDFHAESKASVDPAVVEMGGHVKTGINQPVELVFALPHLQLESYPGAERPIIRAELHYIDEKGVESVVSKLEQTADDHAVLKYMNPKAGHYRVHVWLTPLHLKSLIHHDSLAETSFQWIVSNPIQVTQ